MIAIRNHELNNDFKEFLLITLELKKSFKSWCTNISLRNPSLFAYQIQTLYLWSKVTLI